MRILIFLFLIIVLTSCDHPKKPYIEELTWPKRTVKLDNDLGTLTIRLPKEFDKFYKFEDFSDHSCGDLKKYRFQNSAFPVLMESGMYYDKADSLYYFTIKHNFKKTCDPPENYVFDTSWLKRIVWKIMADDSLIKIQIPIAHFEEISKNNFAIIGYKNGVIFNLKEDVINLQTARIYALTYINHQILELDFECACSNCDSFIPKMYKALKTVEIKPN